MAQVPQTHAVSRLKQPVLTGCSGTGVAVLGLYIHLRGEKLRLGQLTCPQVPSPEPRCSPPTPTPSYETLTAGHVLRLRKNDNDNNNKKDRTSRGWPWAHSLSSALGEQIHQGASLNFTGNSSCSWPCWLLTKTPEQVGSAQVFVEAHRAHSLLVESGRWGQHRPQNPLPICQPPTSACLSSLPLLKVMSVKPSVAGREWESQS